MRGQQTATSFSSFLDDDASDSASVHSPPVCVLGPVRKSPLPDDFASEQSHGEHFLLVEERAQSCFTGCPRWCQAKQTWAAASLDLRAGQYWRGPLAADPPKSGRGDLPQSSRERRKQGWGDPSTGEDPPGVDIQKHIKQLVSRTQNHVPTRPFLPPRARCVLTHAALLRRCRRSVVGVGTSSTHRAGGACAPIGNPGAQRRPAVSSTPALHADWARPYHICPETGLAHHAATSCVSSAREHHVTRSWRA